MEGNYMKEKPVIFDAVKELTTQGFCWDYAEDCLTWFEKNTGDPPTRAEIDAKLLEMQAEYDAQEYARNRQDEFPSIQDLVVALYDTDDKSAVEAKRAEVKAKYPKG
tara:strand:+ start:132 stop:452 length:321 start_codon:yes stop_codon:yes gene_type:complete